LRERVQGSERHRIKKCTATVGIDLPAATSVNHQQFAGLVRGQIGINTAKIDEFTRKRVSLLAIMMNCVIVDDEPLAREGLIDFIREVDFLRIAGTFENPVQLIRFLDQHSVDLVFLDIQMPKMSGIDFLKIRKNPPMAIMTTAFSDFALEGYQLNVLDYLLKPITFNRFLLAVEKARDYQRFLSKSNNQDTDYFFIKCGNNYEKIFLGDILYLESMQNYVNVFTVKGKYTTLLNLKTIEERFKSNDLMRVHKSYMVAVKKINSIVGNEIRIQSATVPISRSYRKQVFSRVVNDNIIEHTFRDKTAKFV